VKRELERIEIPGEHEARTRAWLVVQAAFADRELVPRRRSLLRPVVVLAAVGVLAGIIASPPGRAVIDRVREVVGVESAKPALFSLPTSGRLLVSSDAGVWVVSEDGSRRLLGDWSEASWSPFGRFVVAAKENELAALEPGGEVRWTLARPNVRFPRWGGGRTDTRLAYLSGSELRVVAGDGTGDRKACAASVAPVAPAWRPGGSFQLAVAARDGTVRVYDVETCRLVARSVRLGVVRSLEWSRDGSRLLVRGRRKLWVLDPRAHELHTVLGPGAAPVQAALLGSDGHEIAFVQNAAHRSQLWIIPHLGPDRSAARRLFAGAGSFDELAWSPDGRWLLVTWPAADQWVFVRVDGRGIRAAASISEQFRSSTSPHIEGWCCAG
jgi:WD40 repeat protein